MFRPPIAAGVLLLCLAAVSVAGQSLRFSSTTTGVRVDVLVLNRNAPVTGLTAADFSVKDNGVDQVVDVVESADVPINVILAFDGSGSTTGKRITDLTDAAQALIADLRPTDRIALTTFNHAVVMRVPLTTEFARVSTALGVMSPWGQTAVMDGIHAALMTTQAEPGRSLVIVCTDGRDTQSWLQADEVAEVARRSNAVVYVVAAGTARRWDDLKTLTDITGGHTIEIDKTSDFRAQLVNVIRQFRGRYVLTFTPKGVPAGGYHRLTVTVANRSGVTVKARTGYMSNGPGGER